MNRRRILLLVALGLGLPLLAVVGFFATIFASFPTQQGARIDAGTSVGVETEGAYAWVVPTATGVVVVDGGMDVEAKALKQEIGDRPVHAVLVTHGHFDHVAGLLALAPPVIYGGPGESPIIRGEVTADGFLQKIFAGMMDYPADPPAITEVTDEQVLTIDGTQVRAIHLPGHTRGSTAWVIGDTVFTGDAALGHGDHLAPVHGAFSEDKDQAMRSLSKLDGVAARVADGHAGLHAMP